jgi:threonyl-tRNA synthetase
MLHRVILGAIERFMGVLIEHYAGAFPVWLSPVQAILVTVTDRHVPYGEELYKLLLSEEIRIERDFKNEKLGHKIREAQMQKIPYMLVIGDKEVESRGISPRQRDGKNLGMMNPEQFVAMVRAKVSKYE